MTSGYLTFDLTLYFDRRKWHDRSTFVMIFYELSNAACRMSLRSSGAELDEGGRKNDPPKHSMENPDHQHGEG